MKNTLISDVAYAMGELVQHFPVGVALVDESGSVLYANPLAEKVIMEKKKHSCDRSHLPRPSQGTAGPEAR
ncbi:hypothetical protein Adeg_1815 [Ammonifex degensii KC4]|uniref:PAS domain-containing protein n=1 Tax=Ammonifex degensii (strain DSM 10501 / KC4) TaxID=429009 RepID=C9R9C3_AMMDK|nr:hypothetical protein [Ammonifex degensii]ACX52902.1 hypothetical protein Adeg_1815 [Ammonifex degensii KC4]